MALHHARQTLHLHTVVVAQIVGCVQRWDKCGAAGHSLPGGDFSKPCDLAEDRLSPFLLKIFCGVLDLEIPGAAGPIDPIVADESTGSPDVIARPGDEQEHLSGLAFPPTFTKLILDGVVDRLQALAPHHPGLHLFAVGPADDVLLQGKVVTDRSSILSRS